MSAPVSDPFLHRLYDSLHDTSMQRRIRTLRPMPFGVVFLPWDGMSEEELRAHLRLIRELGFTNLKQTMATPEWPRARIHKIAWEEGVIPFWYGEGGWEAITPELLERLGIPSDLTPAEQRAHPAMIAHQREVIRRRLSLPSAAPAAVEGTVLQAAGMEQWGGRDVQLHSDPVLRDDALPLFKAWVRRHYASVQDLARAWHGGEVGHDAANFPNWEAFESDPLDRLRTGREYGFVRDVLRFKADRNLERIREAMEPLHRRDPSEPQRAGGEMGLFLPFAWRGTDMEGVADLMKDYGSFYPSIHLAWHFEEVGYEVARCVYMQAALTVDWFKGGWSATWESTGGPQQFSGGKGWHPNAADEVAGFTVDAGVITQLLLSYLAAGYRGAGIWAWNHRRAGWEAGEFALVDRQMRAGDRAVRAGRIAQAANRFRDELWEAHREPEVGVFVDWENEAIWAALSVRGRDHYRHFPVRARVGVCRALIDANIPFEHVTLRDLRAGLAPRYRTIVLPAHLAIADETLDLLHAYATAGGRVVLDAPGGYFDIRGRLLPTGAGSRFERLFGVEIRDFQYARNVPRSIEGEPLEGFVLDLNPTRARTLLSFDQGGTASTECAVGTGTSVVLGFEASLRCWRPGADTMQHRLCAVLAGHLPRKYRCDQAIVHRLAAPAADHYFLINDGPATSALLETPGYHYSAASDAISGEPVGLGEPIALEPHSGRWLRFTK
jgi:beta-galactosidase